MGRSNVLAFDDKRLKRISKKLQKADRQKRFLSTDELIKAATVDFSKVKNARERLELSLQIIDNALPIAEGLFRLRPSQSNSYALGAMIDRMQSLTDQLEAKVDYEVLTDQCVKEVIYPIIESLVLELGKTIRAELKSLGEDLKVKDKRRVKESFDSMYRGYGKLTQKKSKKIAKDLLKFLKRR